MDLNRMDDKNCRQVAASIADFIRFGFPIRKNFQRFRAKQLFHKNLAARNWPRHFAIKRFMSKPIFAASRRVLA
jgi:hypothetical protein